MEAGGLSLELGAGSEACVVRLAFEGARDDAALRGEDELPAARNYYVGTDPKRWRTGVSSYASILYQGLYQGVDLRLREREGRLEYDVLLAAEADLSAVVVACEGTQGLELELDGTLVLRTTLGPLRQSPPSTWEVLPSGERRPIASRFVLLGEHRYGFEIAGRDPSLAAVIDPGLEWSTYLGGYGADWLTGVAAGASGRVFVAGMTRSDILPGTAGPLGGPQDGFVACLDPGQEGPAQLVWATYLGGASRDIGYRLAVDGPGNVNLVGETKSADFPVTPGAYDQALSGSKDAFVARMSSAGVLLYSTFLGGSKDDAALVVDLMSDGSVALAGKTVSADFPSTPGAFDPSFNGGTDVFVSVLKPQGAGASVLVYSTYLGGSDLEGIFPDPDLILMALDCGQNGAIAVAASTRSDDLPLVNPYSATRAGEFDVFAAKLKPAGLGAQDLVYSTYIGTPGTEQPMSIVLEPSGRMAVSASTWSNAFPTTPGALQPAFGGGPIDSVWFELDPMQLGASQLSYSTYWGGSSVDHIADFEIDSTGAVIAVGWTGYETGVPTGDMATTCGAYDRSFNGLNDAFIIGFMPLGHGSADLLYSTFLGGPGDDALYCMALVSGGSTPLIVATGWSKAAAGFPTTLKPLQSAYQGLSDGIVVALDLRPQIEHYGAGLPSSVGPGARIDGSCSVSVADNTFTLSVTGAVPGQVGLFLFSHEKQWLPLGDGVACIGNGLAKVFLLGAPLAIDASGSASQWVDFTQPPVSLDPGLLGSPWYFQFWYTDPASSGAGYNLSDALSVRFTP